MSLQKSRRIKLSVGDESRCARKEEEPTPDADVGTGQRQARVPHRLNTRPCVDGHEKVKAVDNDGISLPDKARRPQVDGRWGQ